MSSTSTRMPKRQYTPPPPTPKILHFPRRPRRRAPKSSPAGKPAGPISRNEDIKQGKLETLFGQERAFLKSPVVVLEYITEGRRERVGEGEEYGGEVEDEEEEKWRFQAEMLRAECNLLRMDKEVVVKRMERIKAKMERTLKSAVHTLVSGRKKICEGRNVSMVLDQEIHHLVEKLKKLQRHLGGKGMEVRKSSNLDKQSYLLQRRVEKFRGTSDELCVKEIQEMAEASLSIKTCYRGTANVVSSGKSNTAQVERLRRRMEGLSNGMLLKRMKEEYSSMLSTANNSVANSASSSQRIESTNLSSALEREFHGENVCSGRCKAIVRRIVEQVRAETEQWSQMQEMLAQVREEMEELQASRDFWEDRALDSDYHIQSLSSAVQEWRQKAVASERKASDLQEQLSVIHAELNSLRKGDNTTVKKNSSPPKSRGPKNKIEKQVLICHLKENHCTKEYSNKQREVLREGRKRPDSCTNKTLIDPNAPKRSPFGDIGNTTLSSRQKSKAVFPLHCPLPLKT